MSDANRVTELDLLAYADGRLDDDPGRKAAVEAALRADPAAMTRAKAFRAQTRALRGAYDWRLAEPVPERLEAALEHPARRGIGRALHMAAVALLVVGAGVTGWLLGHGHDGGGTAAVTRLVEQSYAQFVAERPGAAEGAIGPPIGAAASESEPLDWLADEISLRLKAPDLSEAGFSLAGKEAVSAGAGQVVRLDYAGPDGRGFSLFLMPRWDARSGGITQIERGGISMAYWLEGPLASTLVTRLPASETKALAETVRRAMHAAGDAPARIEALPVGQGARGIEVMADGKAPVRIGAPRQPLSPPDGNAVRRD